MQEFLNPASPKQQQLPTANNTFTELTSMLSKFNNKYLGDFVLASVETESPEGVDGKVKEFQLSMLEDSPILEKEEATEEQFRKSMGECLARVADLMDRRTEVVSENQRLREQLEELKHGQHSQHGQHRQHRDFSYDSSLPHKRLSSTPQIKRNRLARKYHMALPGQKLILGSKNKEKSSYFELLAEQQENAKLKMEIENITKKFDEREVRISGLELAIQR